MKRVREKRKSWEKRKKCARDKKRSYSWDCFQAYVRLFEQTLPYRSANQLTNQPTIKQPASQSPKKLINQQAIQSVNKTTWEDMNSHPTN